MPVAACTAETCSVCPFSLIAVVRDIIGSTLQGQSKIVRATGGLPRGSAMHAKLLMGSSIIASVRVFQPDASLSEIEVVCNLRTYEYGTCHHQLESMYTISFQNSRACKW
jgi:hypothetical protein